MPGVGRHECAVKRQRRRCDDEIGVPRIHTLSSRIAPEVGTVIQDLIGDRKNQIVFTKAVKVQELTK